MRRLLSDIAVKDGVVTFHADPAFTRRHLKQDFFVDYSACGIADNALRALALPAFILNVAPIVWYYGEEMTVPEMDRDLAETLEHAKGYLKAGYRSSEWRGSLTAEATAAARARESGDSVLLFSGGLDSAYSHLCIGAGGSGLLAVWGADIPLQATREWQSHLDGMSRYAAATGARLDVIRSNVQDFVKVKSPSADIPLWWSYVQHGLGLVGLAAPVAAARGAGVVTVSASHTEAFDPPWGSHPTLEGRIVVGGIHTAHVGFELTRQGKLRALVRTLHEKGLDEVPLRVCLRQFVRAGNCGRCEKCLRTMAGLLLEDCEPRRFGFAVSKGDAAARIRDAFGAYRLKFSESRKFFWQDLRVRAAEVRDERSADSESRRLAAFLVAADLDAYLADYRRRHRITDGIRNWIARHPRSFDFARTIYERLSS